jgi:tetratricopeptide (TPR) repeat protein
MNSKEKVLLHKGMDRVRRMRYEEAAAIFDKVISTNPEITEAWNNRGVALYRMGRIEEAIESYDKSLALDGSNLDALRNKGLALRRTGRLQEALECYDKVINAGGEPQDLESKAAVLASMGMLEEALAIIMEAIKIKPSQAFEDEIEMLKQMIEQREGSSQPRAQ